MTAIAAGVIKNILKSVCDDCNQPKSEFCEECSEIAHIDDYRDDIYYDKICLDCCPYPRHREGR